MPSFSMKGKSGAIELSIGTIVVIVLSMSMLILGLVLVKNIFSGATNIVDMTNDQLMDQVSKLFGDDKKLVVYPNSREVFVKSGEASGFGIGIKNLLTGSSSETIEFRYAIKVAETGNCPVSEEKLLELIVTGRELSPTKIAPGGDPIVRKVKLDVPEGFPLCSFSYQINSFHSGSSPYATEFMDVTIKA